MTKNLDLQELERKAYRTTFQDGLTDVLLGSVFVVMSMVSLFESWGLPRLSGYLAAFGLLFLVWAMIRFVKIHVVLPRLGTAVFSVDRHKRIKQARIGLAVMVIVTVGLVLATATGLMQTLFGAFNAWSGYLFIGAIFVITLSLLAFFLDYPRLYLYGWFLALMDPFTVWLAGKTGWIFPRGATIFGLVIILIGVVTFLRFLRQHPQPQQSAI